MTDAPRHIPVLLAETLDRLGPRAGETMLDCTAGLGGHAAEFGRAVGASGTVILNDHDASNLTRAAEAVRAADDAAEIVEVQGNFADLARKLVERGLAADIVLADLGFSSNQMQDAARGFSFMRPGPLDMRLDPSGGSAPVTAAELVNTLPEVELSEIIRDLGEERWWRRITQKIVEERARSPITTTERLASIVRSASPFRPRGDQTRIDPATRTFQALRIAVNDELGSLRSLLEAVSRSAAGMAAGVSGSEGGCRVSWLRPGARIGVISFHSLEDRLVKQAFGELARRGLGEAITRKPVEAGDAEVAANPRSRSAKLRVIRLRCG